MPDALETDPEVIAAAGEVVDPQAAAGNPAPVNPTEKQIVEAENRLGVPQARKKIEEADAKKSADEQAMAQKEDAAVADWQSASEKADKQNLDLIYGEPDNKLTPPKYEPVTMEDVHANIFPLLALATLGGLGVRRHAIGAMKSFSAMLQGAEEGKKEAYEANKTKYEADLARLKNEQAEYDKKVKAVMANNKLTLDERLHRIDQINREAGRVSRADTDAVNRYSRTADQLEKDALMQAKLEAEAQKTIAKSAAQQKMIADMRAQMDPGITAMVATGADARQFMGVYGQQASLARTMYTSAAIDMIMRENPGMNRTAAAQELVQRQMAMKSTAGALNFEQKMLGATQQATDQLHKNIELAKKSLAKIPDQTHFTILNDFINGTSRRTGGAEVNSWYFLVDAVANEAARLQSSGQASAAQLHSYAQELARKWLDPSITPQAFLRLAETMEQEGQLRTISYKNAISQMIGGFGRPGGVDANAGAAPGGAATSRYNPETGRIEPIR